jgi:thiosulfate sulfurtransferase
MSYKRISIDEAKAIIASREVTLVDVRDSGSFSARNIKNSINVLSENIAEFLDDADKAKPLIAYCYHGNNSQGAAAYFFAQGFTEVYSMDGGFEEWSRKYECPKGVG